MHFQRLMVHNFRNYSDLNLLLNPKVNIFVGENGQGKTNLIEAVHILAKGNSFRAGKPEVWSRQSENKREMHSLISADICQGQLTDQVVWKTSGDQRTFLLNQKRISSAVLGEKFPIVLFSPESLSAIKEGPEQRRLLIDDVLYCHGEGIRIIEFKRALKSRNRILRDHRDGIYTEKQVHELLDAFDQIYLPICATLAFSRVRKLRELLPHIIDALKFISEKDYVDISVDYEISSQSAWNFDLREIVEQMRNRLKVLRKSEISTGTTLVGPHKHEVNFLNNGNDARYFCSQGQQRALILGFKMAQIMYHYRVFQVHPILLLDDVLSELDPHKGSNLLKFLEGIQSQIILTTTDISFPFDFGSNGMSLYRMKRENDCGMVEKLRA